MAETATGQGRRQQADSIAVVAVERHQPSVADDAQGSGLIGDSARIAIASALSRITGLARIMVSAAVLGPTVLGDLFVAVNVLPLVLYDVLAGSAISSVLVPPLVRYLRAGDRAAAGRLAANSLGVIVVSMAVVAGIAVAARSVIAGVLTSGVDDALRSDAMATAALLAAVILPQLVLYAAIGVFVSVQHANRNFLLPSVAPVIENLGLVATVVIVFLRFGRGWEVDTAPRDLMLLLALGSGCSVAAHAIVQYAGARRSAGRSLRPSLHWRHPDLIALARPTADSFIWSSVIAARQFALVVAAGFAGAGGVQAFQLAMLAYFVPLALIGRPIASAALPRLVGTDRSQQLSKSTRLGYRRAVRLASWLAVPAGLGLLVMSRPLATVVARGDFADPAAVTLITAALAGLAIGAASEALFEVARQTSMASGSAVALRRSTLVRAVVSIVGIPVTVAALDGPALLVGLGLVVTVSDLTALLTIHRPLRATRSVDADPRHWPRLLLSAIVAAGPTILIDRAATDWSAASRVAVSSVVLVGLFAASAWVTTDQGRLLSVLENEPGTSE